MQRIRKVWPLKWLGVIAIVALGAAACEYDPAEYSGVPFLSECNGTPATIGVGWTQADGPDGATHLGTEGDDVVVILNGPVVFDGLGGNDLICVNASSIGWGPAPVAVIRGGAGDDRVHNHTDHTVLASLGEGDDSYDGGGGRDLVAPGPGVDAVMAGAGDDVVWGSGHEPGESVECGTDGRASGTSSGDLYLTATPYWAVDGVSGCEIVEAGGHVGEPILVTSTATLETEAGDPANADRSIVLLPGEYVLTQRLSMPDGVRLLSADGADGTTIECKNIGPGPDPDFDNPYGCIEGQNHFNALTITSSNGPLFGLPFGIDLEYKYVGLLLRNGGSVRDSSITRFGSGIHAYVDTNGATAHFVLEHNSASVNIRGVKSGSGANRAVAWLTSRNNNLSGNVATGHLMQSGNNGGNENSWIVVSEHNTYDSNGESGVYVATADEEESSSDNRLLLVSRWDHAEGNILTDDTRVGDFSFSNDTFTLETHDRNETVALIAHADIGSIVFSPGRNFPHNVPPSADNTMLVGMSTSTVGKVTLSNGSPLPAGTTRVLGNVESFLATNDIGTLQTAPLGEDICTFFTAGC